MMLPHLPRYRVELQSEFLHQAAIDDSYGFSHDAVIKVRQIRQAVLQDGAPLGFDGDVLAVDQCAIHVPQHGAHGLHDRRPMSALSSRLTLRISAKHNVRS